MIYWLLKAVLKPILGAVYRIEVEGVEHVPRRGPAIIAANHISFLDSFFIPLVIPRRKVTYLAKADYFRSWKTAWFFRAVGQISCEREGGKRSAQSLEIAAEVLAVTTRADGEIPREAARDVVELDEGSVEVGLERVE